MKPANIALTTSDQIKVLDFGLAKAGDALNPSVSPPAVTGEANQPNLVLSPTVTVTEPGMLIGTAAHMSPEQAKGRAADKRSDIWAFGTVFYEMLTGVQAFDGEDVLETLTSVMRDEPDWRRLPVATPAHVRTLLERCLKKDRRQRLSDVAVVQFLLDAPSILSLGDVALPSTPAAVVPAWQRAIVPVGAAIAGALVASAVWSLRAPNVAPPPITRFALALREGEQFTGGRFQQVAISPDGTRVVYVANNRLYLRSMQELTGKVIPGTDLLGGVWNPVFSPDSQTVAFGTPYDSTIKRIGVAGGASVTLCTTCGYRSRRDVSIRLF